MSVRSTVVFLVAAAFLSLRFAAVAAPRDSLPFDAAEWPENYRIHLDGAGTVHFTESYSLALPEQSSHDVAVEFLATGAPVLRVWTNGTLVTGPIRVPELAPSSVFEFPEANLPFDADFTAFVRFEAGSDGALLSRCAEKGEWSRGAKALFIRGGRLVYDVGWIGAMTGGPKVTDSKQHAAVLVVEKGSPRLWLDGKQIAENPALTSPDDKAHIFKVGRTAPNFVAPLQQGEISAVRYWRRALEEEEIALLFKDGGAGANTPDFTHLRGGGSKPVVKGTTGWVQALERSDHSSIVAGWNQQTLAEGEAIYKTLCVVCHGTVEAPGSLPTALRFAEGQFKNGSDPYSMYVTLTKGYGQMVPQPQYTTAQKYAVIQYIREAFLRDKNPTQFSEVNLAALPKGLEVTEAEQIDRTPPPYKQMELGNTLHWTLQVAPGNIPQKAIAVRLDDGPGGVTKGRAWMIYDHDTLRVATATTGDFVDWKGIAFDGSHGTHTSLVGEKQFVNPVGPGWSTGEFEDTRTKAKDGKFYGPVKGLRFLGVYKSGTQTVIAANVHGTAVLESPSWMDYGATPVFIRTINLGEGTQSLRLRVAPENVAVMLRGPGTLAKENGFWVATLPPKSQSRIFVSRAEPSSLASLSASYQAPMDVTPLTRGGPAQWSQTVTTTSVPGKEPAPFVADTFPLPVDNPWHGWMRPGGFDFTPDGKGAVVAMWNGDVWRVDGIFAKAPAPLTWRRIASGLFQPLGVKFRGTELFITCRDQIARLHDLNSDGEIDFVECFNDDAQVTEHFHEFAMGLQVDVAGNFYYAKSARHALDSVVPQHGTLLKVAADGSRTEIIATGFRAANGVCINDDGSFFVTDQEGHWTPKNRINRVKPGGFYGNMYGYSAVTNPSDSAMEQPMVWITNNKDRSPAELLWVPKTAWGPLAGSLLNLSYGTGRIFVVPHEQVGNDWQGAVCELPLPAFPSGIMRGRFGPDNALYSCGMFAWAGNATAPGSFHRIRLGTEPARVPLTVRATKGALKVTFSDPLTGPIPETTLSVWSLKRSSKYGSQHYDEHPVTIRSVNLSADRRTVTVEVPDLGPTQCYALKIGDRELHGTIHQVAAP